jgi:hypothetical protein
MPRLLLRSRRHPVVATIATPFGLMIAAAGLVALAGVFSLSFAGMGWIFALLVLAAVVTALAQQTLP